MTALLVIGLMVATWRVTRLILKDEWPPVRAVRDWVIRTWGIIDQRGHVTGGRHLGEIGHAIAYLWTCSWCMSVWVAAALVALADWRVDVPYPWLVGGLGAGFTGVMSWVENEHDQRYEQRRIQIDREIVR